MVEPYYSCEWLESGLTFAPDGLYACCVLHHGDRGWPKICNFKGGLLPVEKIREVREEIVQMNQSQQFENCRLCAFLKKKLWGKSDYLINVINLSHSTHCNLKCSYCYLQLSKTGKHWWDTAEILKSGETPYPLVPTFRAMIADGLLAPEAVINWGGGEPLLLKEFDALFELTVDYGNYSTVATNGTIFSEALAQGLCAGRADIVCSVDAGGAAAYLKIKERDYFERVWANLATYAEYGLVTAKYIFISQNSSKKELLAFFNRANAAGVKNIVCDVDAFSSEYGKDLASLISLARNEAEKLGLNLSIGGCGVVSFPEKKVNQTSKGSFFSTSQIKRKVESFKEKLKIRLFGELELQGGKANPEWQSGIKNETAFWESWIKGKGLEWSDDFLSRIVAGTELQNYITELLPEKDIGSDVQILDVGAGPMTRIGKHWDGRQITIFPIDIEAVFFDRILQEYDIVPPVRTVFGEVERLTELFEASFFDLVYAENLLHCSYKPITALRQMIRVLKPGGTILLTQSQNEGRKRNYKGLYQWNIFSQDGDMMIGNENSVVNISSFFSDNLKVACQTENEWINVILQKNLVVI